MIACVTGGASTGVGGIDGGDNTVKNRGSAIGAQ